MVGLAADSGTLRQKAKLRFGNHLLYFLERPDQHVLGLNKHLSADCSHGATLEQPLNLLAKHNLSTPGSNKVHLFTHS